MVNCGGLLLTEPYDPYRLTVNFLFAKYPITLKQITNKRKQKQFNNYIYTYYLFEHFSCFFLQDLLEICSIELLQNRW